MVTISKKTKLEEYLIKMLDSIITAKDITYGEFNNIISFDGDERDNLRQIKQEYPELGIAKYKTYDEGISTMSIMASITSVLIGKRLAVILGESELQDTDKDNDDDRLILGFTFIEDGSLNRKVIK